MLKQPLVITKLVWSRLILTSWNNFPSRGCQDESVGLQTWNCLVYTSALSAGSAYPLSSPHLTQHRLRAVSQRDMWNIFHWCMKQSVWTVSLLLIAAEGEVNSTLQTAWRAREKTTDESQVCQHAGVNRLIRCRCASRQGGKKPRLRPIRGAEGPS